MMYQPTAPSSSSSLLLRLKFGEFLESLREEERKRLLNAREIKVFFFNETLSEEEFGVFFFFAESQ